MARLSIELQRFFFEEEQSPQVTLTDVLSLAGERVFGFLFVVLSLPSALPIPAPGYSVPFGLAMLPLAIQLMMGAQRPWLPKKIVNQPIELTQLQKIIKTGLPWFRRIETITRPRLTYICTSVLGRIFLGIAIALMSISMMIPIPGTNTAPAIGIFVTGFGLLEDDGVISLGGLTICLIWSVLMASILVALIFGGSSLVDMLKEWLQTL
ncbi:MAG: exopolysaccharide biosynthesis protein [Cyanothece sp. SIO1E1]|nr:exopolysaccharide biosynthesis protein [Cyanothece sp. SIO1E1]